MKIEHLSIYTKDLERLRQFYETYFHAEANAKYHNKSTGLETYFLSFGDGARLELMMRPNLTARAEGHTQEGYIHMAFQLGSREAVDRLTRKMETEGFTVLSQPRVTGDGYYESCVLDPDGNQLELVG